MKPKPNPNPIRVLSVIPPMTQLNTPYPSTAYLTGFLRSRGVTAFQEDLALKLVLTLFTSQGLEDVKARALQLSEAQRSASVNFFLDFFQRYVHTIQPTIAFLQGKDSTLSHRIAGRGFLPEGPRFAALDAYDDSESGDPLSWAFGALGQQDRARHLATLYLNDLADVLRDAVDSRFEFVRYGESLAGSQATFEPLANALAAPLTLMDEALQTLTLQAIDKHQPSLVLLSVPFPGAVYAAFRIAQCIKQQHPHIHIALGGGFVNTELRELTEPRVFDYVDFVTLDSGERPLLALLEHLEGKRSASRLVRTYIRQSADELQAVNNATKSQRVQLINWSEPDVPFEEVGTATWDGLPLQDYLSLLDMLNPMHRLWSDGRWNKLTVAHGCYWKKCSFCDVSLDYISRYETASATLLVDRIEQIVQETGQTGFHFVDEAAPPKALKALAEELIRRNVHISWWGNIRFEKTFTPELSELLAESGCIAMSGGLEVASDRLLTLMKKGVTVEQVAQVTKGFSEAGILVHAYLMYGFPTQTIQDTVDALEYVRQLFENGCIQSGFFHRFACTVHSPVGLNPKEYGIELVPLPPVSFGKNDIGFTDPTGVDHDLLGLGLKKAIYNFMHGIGLEQDVRTWFQDALNEHAHEKSTAFKIPKSTVSKRKIEQALQSLQSKS
jgi:tRNA A37 methylthiotransferase MiaB